MVQENLIELFANSFRSNWDLPGYTNYGESQTFKYADIAKKVAELHILFEQCNIKRDDKIALIGKNSSQWAIAYIATVTYGAIVVPILHDFNPNDVEHIANHSESKLLFAEESIWETLENQKFSHVESVFSLQNFDCLNLLNQSKLDKELLNSANIAKLFGEKYPNGFSHEDIQYAEKSNSELASINYTSGTTGFSKGVMTLCNNLAGNIVFAMNSKLLQPNFRIVAFLPMAHAYGCAFDFLGSTCAGCHIYFINKIPTPQVLLKAFAEVKPTMIFAVPLIIEKIYKKRILPKISSPVVSVLLKTPGINQLILSKIRKTLVDAFGGEFIEVIVGGAPLSADVEDFFRKMKFPITVGYGMTECAPLISYAGHKEFVPKSCGKILDCMEVKIKDPNPETGTGEICVRGEHVMAGYYKNTEATEQVFEDGWLLTGDLGTVDAKGNITIRGREKTMILGGNGQNIYPEEIEAKLNNMPYVMESLVLESSGGKLVALVYPDKESVDAEQLAPEQLEEKLEENRKNLNNILGNYEKIQKVKIYPHEFEKTPKKSIKRFLYSADFDNK